MDQKAKHAFARCDNCRSGFPEGTVCATKTHPSLAVVAKAEDIPEGSRCCQRVERSGEQLGALVPHLPPELRLETLTAALAAASANEKVGERIIVLTDLVELLRPEQRTIALSQILSAALAVKNLEERASVVVHLSSLSPPAQTARALSEVLTAAMTHRNPDSPFVQSYDFAEQRTRALITLARNIPDEKREAALAEALVTASAIENDGRRGIVLEWLLNMEKQVAFSNEREILLSLVWSCARKLRPIAFSTLTSTIAAAYRVAGDKTLEGLYRTIEEIGAWFP